MSSWQAIDTADKCQKRRQYRRRNFICGTRHMPGKEVQQRHRYHNGKLLNWNVQTKAPSSRKVHYCMKHGCIMWEELTQSVNSVVLILFCLAQNFWIWPPRDRWMQSVAQQSMCRIFLNFTSCSTLAGHPKCRVYDILWRDYYVADMLLNLW